MTLATGIIEALGHAAPIAGAPFPVPSVHGPEVSLDDAVSVMPPEVAYIDNIDGDPVSPIFAFHTEEAYDTTMAALAFDPTRRGLLNNMRERKGSSSPVTSDMFTGGEVELGDWEKGDYNWKIFQGEKARQLNMALGEFAVNHSELPYPLSADAAYIAAKVIALHESIPAVNQLSNDVDGELQAMAESRLPSATAAADQGLEARTPTWTPRQF